MEVHLRQAENVIFSDKLIKGKMVSSEFMKMYVSMLEKKKVMLKIAISLGVNSIIYHVAIPLSHLDNF